MENKYVVRANSSNSQPMSREEAIKKVKEYEQRGIMAYIVSEEAGSRLEDKNYNASMWT